MPDTQALGRGPAPSGTPPLLPADVKFIAVHCSATPVTADIGAKEIDRWHRNQGWAGIGYHYVIRRNGVLEEGRPVNRRGAHVEDYNHCSIGICMVGGVDATKAMKPEANFAPEQYATLTKLLYTMKEWFPTAVVQGHRDFPHVTKACPSFDVKHWHETGTIKP